MTWPARLLRLIHNLLRRARLEQELDDEIRSYAEMLADEKIQQGTPRDEALRAARIELGGIEQVKEQVRDARAGAWIGALLQDLRYGARAMRRTPGFAAIAIVMLALGIGVNTALFSVVHALLLRDLPYKSADRLVYVTEFWPHEPVVPGPPSPDFANWRSHSRLVDGIEAYGGGGALNLTGAGEPERIQGTMVTRGFLDLIGIRPALGRTFTAEEDLLGGPRAVILGHGVWQRLFGASPQIVGNVIELDSRAYTIVGVLPADFAFPDNHFRADILVPMALPRNPNWQDEQNLRLLRVVARLKPGATPAALRAEFAGLLQRTAAEEPPQFVTMRKDMEVRVAPLRDRLSGDVRTSVLLLQAAVAMVFLIGCLNVANLQVARSISRQKEMALRAALGAGRTRLMRQLLTESVLLSLLGGMAGLLLGYAVLPLVRSFLPANLHLAATVGIDHSVLGFAIVIALMAGVVTGLAPILTVARTPLQETLKEGSAKASVSIGYRRLHGALVIAEVAIAMVLLTGSGLLVRSFLYESGLDPGFDRHGVLTLRVPLPSAKYATPESRRQFFSQLLEGAPSIPGVRNAAVASGLPLIGTRSGVGTWIEGIPVPPKGARPVIPIAGVSSDYFTAVGIPVLQGRGFTAADREGASSVVVVNQAFVDQFFPGQDATGKRILFGREPASEIVGIAGNVRQQGLRSAAAPTIYTHYRQFPEPEMLLVLRSGLPTRDLAEAARRAIHAVDPNQPLYDVATMEDRIDEALAPQRAKMILMGAFAALALALAAIGIFGVIAYFVSRRSHEIGIRMALGARASDVLRMVLGHGMALTASGIAVGLAGALLAAQALRPLLFGISASDPLTLAVAPALFACVAAAACYLPARWATRVDPMVTLRHE